MNDYDFNQWLSYHLLATGSQSKADVADSLLANQDIIAGPTWGASLVELMECSRRLVATCRVPGFADEHLKAVGLELIALRKDASRAASEFRRPIPNGPKCPTCDGDGWVTVPLVRCVWHGQLVTYRDRDGLDHGYVPTGAVTCDDCDAGRRERDIEADRVNKMRAKFSGATGRPTYTQYTALVNGADGVALLKEHERQRRAVNVGDEIPGSFFKEFCPRLWAMHAENMR
jgi:hypothetical protein